jgi:hypothetical protein
LLAAQLAPEVSFGIPALGSVASNWVNTKSNTVDNLMWSNATPSTINFAMTQPNAQASFNAIYGGTPLLAGIDDYTATLTPTSVSFSNLNANFTNGYIAIVYLNGFISNTGSSISDGTTSYYWRPANPVPASLPSPLVQTLVTADPGLGNFPVAQYAVFGTLEAPLSADSLTLTLRALSGGGTALGGVQLVGVVPEPATYALVTGLAILGALVWRRRR